MNKRTCYAVVLLMLMFSCSGQNALKDNLTVLPWEFSENESIPDLIDSVEFIVLEAHPEGLFKKADKLIVQNNKFFIFDMTGQNQVSVFDNAGKFLYRVGSRGNGPGEYVGIRNFTTDEKYIHIIDNYTGKLLMYHIADGTYAGTKKLPFIAHDMIIAENGDYVFARQRIEGEYPPEEHAFHIMITDMDFHIKHKLFPFQKEDCGVWSQHCYFTSADEHIVFHTMVADSVVLLNKRVPFAGSGYAVCRMNFGAKKVSRKMENNMDFLADNYRFLTSTPEITSKYVIGSYWHDNEVGSDPYIYDVKKQKVHINNYEAGDVSKFFFPALFHDGDTIFSLYNKDYYSLFEEGDRTFDLLPDKVKKHLDAGDDVLIKYILK